MKKYREFYPCRFLRISVSCLNPISLSVEFLMFVWLLINKSWYMRADGYYCICLNCYACMNEPPGDQCNYQKEKTFALCACLCDNASVAGCRNFRCDRARLPLTVWVSINASCMCKHLKTVLRSNPLLTVLSTPIFSQSFLHRVDNVRFFGALLWLSPPCS